MKIRQRVKRFDELESLKNRLTTFISKFKTKNENIINSTSEDENVISSKNELLKIIAAKEAELAVINEEIREHTYYFKTSKTDLEKYRGTVEYIGEE
jgi:uncharacterized coiled-coil DUF342 family protein